MKPSSSVMLLASFSICLQLLLLFTLILIFPPSCKANSSWSNETDHMSLLKFKELISDDPYHILDSWNTSTHFCNWHGIACGHKHHRVTKLQLDGHDMRGSITPHIGNLSFLRVLVLGNNKLHGEIPQDLSRLFRLQVLNLSNNTLTGKFPVNITSCSKLNYLSFGGNNLIGKIPMQIGSLHNLEKLYLVYNNFSGKIPISMYNLSSLTHLSLGPNNLEGCIPEEIGHLKKLKMFYVGANKLSGKIPTALYNLSSLTIITLASNQFNGSLPANKFINLPNLQILELGGNQISGHIPTSIANATMLELISGGENHFVGQIPNLGKLHYLSVLEFGVNNLGSNSSKDWEFLNSLSNCTKLTQLQLGGNNFGGHLPNTIGNLSTQLMVLRLGQNYISGKIPVALGNLINLTFLSIDMNYFTDIIPITFGNFQKIEELYLLGNKLSGEIIHFIGNLTRLVHLDLSDNILEGKVPPSIENCESLQYLNLSLNRFSGTIPVQLFTLSSLSISLELSHNSFVGNLPKEVGNLKNIGQLGVSYNHLSGSIPQSIGECQSLEYLFLQGNLFQETIPLSLASLKGLRYVDLSQNNLSGSIPKDLQGIALLEYLNVSFNMLDGEVPSKGVFGNASAISLIGNNKLCGAITKLELPPCPVKSTRESKHQNYKLILSISFVIAFLLLASVVAIYYGRKRRNKSSSSRQTIDTISRVSYQSLHNATDGFSINNLIGSGSFGSVYKGRLESNEVVAVKGNEFKAIIYEYMVNGSLYNWLYPTIENPDHHPRVLLLPQVINILIDVASALYYLHHECGQPLVHCDLKPSNVLLDGDMVAHLSDFGLARLLSTIEVISNERSSTVGIKGTIGYVPPEVLTKRRPTEEMFKDGHNLHTYVESSFPNNLLQVVSPTILPTMQSKKMTSSSDFQEIKVRIHPNVEKCICCLFRIGLSCSMELPHERMSAADVIKELISIKRFFHSG
ncbi:hypothetical protein K1719_029774 [Acacia pycnantha]|nr:hypothetical protein K1719_029774 [Acacia pycnantha]